MQKTKKILITEFRQETNSFTPVRSDFEFWKQAGILEGEEVARRLSGKPCAIGGMLAALEEWEEPIEMIGGLVMSCQSGGPAEQSVMDFYLEKLERALEEHLPLDGVLFSFHGAMQSVEFDDVEGEVLRRVRAITGEQCVFAVSTDLHAFISPQMLRYADAIAGYHTYPHVDYFETGYRAATLSLRMLSGETIAMVHAAVPMIVPASAYNTLEGPFRELMQHAESLIQNGSLLDFSVYQMQPWLDVDGYSSILALAADEARAAACAQELAAQLYGMRHQFQQPLYTMDEVIRLAEHHHTGKPVILVDSADSCNAGATGDSMAAVERILALNSLVKAAMVVNDPVAADFAHRLGVGKTATFQIGGIKDTKSVSIQVEGVVKSLHDGTFVQEGPAGRGVENNIGPTAVIRVGSVDLVVCHSMVAPGDPQIFRGFGLEPSLYQLLIVKACTSFRAAYTHISDCICPTDTPGAAALNLKSLPFQRLSRDIYPWRDAEMETFPLCVGRKAPTASL